MSSRSLLALLAVVVVCLVPGCGKGQRVSITNQTGLEIRDVYVESLSSGRESWGSVPRGETVSVRMELSGGEDLVVGWTCGVNSVVREFRMLDNISDASEVNIQLEGNIEKLHVRF
ncbi:hypothetical protein JW921_02035 [Candidatus Fermentibacterales bacterium]|nr:hypothetical protein [Candidatus Fermentibacterales bacterium]